MLSWSHSIALLFFFHHHPHYFTFSLLFLSSEAHRWEGKPLKTNRNKRASTAFKGWYWYISLFVPISYQKSIQLPLTGLKQVKGLDGPFEVLYYPTPPVRCCVTPTLHKGFCSLCPFSGHFQHLVLKVKGKGFPAGQSQLQWRQLLIGKDLEGSGLALQAVRKKKHEIALG